MTVEAHRPRTRADCVDGPRPCPFVGCRYHLLLDVNHKGSLAIARNDNAGPGRPRVLTAKPTAADVVQGWIDSAVEALAKMRETCALDVAERGEHDGVAIGKLLGFTRTRTGQVCEGALLQLRLEMRAMGVEQDLSECVANDREPRGCSPLATLDLEDPRAFSSHVY